MTVRELMKLLWEMDENALVARDDSERGRQDITSVKEEPDYYHPELKLVVIS